MIDDLSLFNKEKVLNFRYSLIRIILKYGFQYKFLFFKMNVKRKYNEFFLFN